MPTKRLNPRKIGGVLLVLLEPVARREPLGILDGLILWCLAPAPDLRNRPQKTSSSRILRRKWLALGHLTSKPSNYPPHDRTYRACRARPNSCPSCTFDWLENSRIKSPRETISWHIDACRVSRESQVTPVTRS